VDLPRHHAGCPLLFTAKLINVLNLTCPAASRGSPDTLLSQRSYCQEIDGDQSADVFLQKGAPRLGRWFAMTDHVLANTSLADVDAQVFSPSMRGAPKWVGTDQIPDFLRDRGPSSSSVPNLPGPKQAEAFVVTGDDGLWFDDEQRGLPISPDFGQPRPEHTVHHSQLRPLFAGVPEHTDLMARRQDLHLEGGPRRED
jgi:hypothetical protein